MRFYLIWILGLAVLTIAVHVSIVDLPAQPDARAILRRAAEAAGGRARFEAIKNFRIKTASEIHLESGTITATITETVELPDKTRQSIELQNGIRVQVLNADLGWVRIGEEKTALNTSQLREMKRGLFRDLLHLYARCNDPDLRIRYIDEKKVAGEHVHIIRVMNLTGDFVDLHIDVESDRVIRKSYQGGAEVKLATLEEVYSDYQDFAGVMLPLITRVTANGKLFLFTRMLTAEFDLELSAETFVD